MRKQLQEIVNDGHIRTVTGKLRERPRATRAPTGAHAPAAAGKPTATGSQSASPAASAPAAAGKPAAAGSQSASPAASPPAAAASASTMVPSAFSSPVPGRPLWISRTVSTLAVLKVV